MARRSAPASPQRVTLITTGVCEERALALSLQRFFPSAEFTVLRRDGFTSAALGPAPAVGGPDRSNLEKLVAEMIALIEPGQRGAPADWVFAVDDLELCNATQPTRVVAHLASAVRAHLANTPWPTLRSQQRATERARERCSFHLLAPMLEAYFFGEPAALVRAGAVRAPIVQHPAGDLEQFTATDAAYLGRATDPEVVWAKPTAAERTRHPKHYTQFLCDPAIAGTPRRSYYRETKAGAFALASLDWSQVLTHPSATQFAHAFMADLADALGVACPFAGVPHPLTAPGKLGVLRNI